MILLDTNVLSEFMRPQPSAAVVGWMDAQSPHTVFTSVISRAEIELGLRLMVSGKRQSGLSEAVQVMFERDLAGRCMPFDEQAALYYGELVAARRRAGRPITVEDAQIAAIALSHGMHLATRNTTDFELIEGLVVCNPWLPNN